MSERLAILGVHTKGKSLAPELDLNIVARGTPGMSGAELSNLVNEAALHAVRQGRQAIGNEDFEYARDRVLMGARRESMALSDAEKELTAYHEAGHAVCATLLPNADPLHKVTILPIGMALGVTQQLPAEDRHSYNQDFLEESIVVAMGGRVAEQLVFGVMTTGAGNDLEVSTNRARRMVTEWGMSPKVGPQAWGGSGQVFLGEDIMQQSRDSYSGAMANTIDEEVERILREAEERCRSLLTENRGGLNMVARSLLEHETIDGATVKRLVAMAAADPQPSVESTSVD
jgi:cell division protease FtsH